MALGAILSLVSSIPEVAGMPDMRAYLDRRVAPGSLPCWDYVPLACAAVGGIPEASLPAAAAIFAQLAAIHLVDDLLDEDPVGLQHSVGSGRAANLALSFSALSHRVLAESELDPTLQCELQGRLARMAMGTALAQDLDLQPCADEAAYWRVVDGKTPPLFACALAMGARIGGASKAQADAVAALGEPLGRLIQIGDDLNDALAPDASADWARPRNNLALLYALVAEHEGRARFMELVDRAPHDPSARVEAQAMLFDCGAASYCVYRMLEANHRAQHMIHRLELKRSEPLTQLFARVLDPVRGLLQRAGFDADTTFAAFEAGMSAPSA